MTPITERFQRAPSVPAVDVSAVDAAVYAYARQVADLPADDPVRSRLREDVVRVALPFAGRLARRYRGRGEPMEDLEQVARLALVRAIDKYDPERGPFTAYAAVTIVGELRRHFRDTTWGVHVPRRLQELSLEVGRASAVLTRELSRTPKVADLARHLDASEGEVREAIDTAAAYVPVSLNAPARDDGTVELGDMLGGSDAGIDGVDDRITVSALLCRLPARERRILAMRFYGNRTQSDIAAELGISQMHVSRLLSRALSWLREAMLSDAPMRWEAGQVVPEAAHLSIHTSVVGGTAVVDVAGEIDRDTAGRLRDRLLAAVRRAGDEVRVDLSRVPFIDAAGISALLVGYEAARGCGLRLRIRRPQRYVRRALLVAGLHPLLDPPPAAGPAR